MTRVIGLLAALAVVTCSPLLTMAQPRQPPGEWRAYAGTSLGLKYSPLDQITKDNVKDLQIVWNWSSVEVDLQKSSPVRRVSRNENTPPLQNFVTGPLFTPPSEKGTLQLPGNLGGANWGGAAFDPESGILYVPSRTTATLARAVPRPATPASPASQDAPPAQGTQINLSSLMNIDGLPLFKPPYARVTALDLNKGERLWTSAVGNGRRNHPLLKDLALPPLGDAVDGISTLATRNVLFVTTWRRQRGDGRPLVPSWQPWGDADAGRKVLYAFDKRSGALVREFDMDGFAAAAPMTYLHRGKQYLVMAVGGNDEAAIVAFGLPGTRGK